MVQATRLFSGDVLAESGSRQVRQTLPLLALDDRITQLCNIEAIEQIRKWKAEFQPDTVTADAMAATALDHLTLDARGGAFRSRRHWYNVQYKCEVARNLASVRNFAFLVGGEIPKSQWKSHYLTASDGSAD